MPSERLFRILPNGKIFRVGHMRGRYFVPCHPFRAERVNRDGYLDLFWRDSSRVLQKCPASRIVWQKFKGEIPEGFDVHHINGKRKDNRLINLEMRRGRHLAFSKEQQEYEEWEKRTLGAIPDVELV